MTNLEKDAKSREIIVSDIRNNYFVEASAGSGKTTMLVNRMVAMVEKGIDIDQICAITFTKAAAGEFYDRFQKLLIERSNPDYKWADTGNAGQLPQPTDETRDKCVRALENIDLCFMGTIDSFCNMVLSEHPSEAGIPSDSSIMSDEDVETLYKQIFIGVCQGKYNSYNDKLEELGKSFQALHKKPESVFVTGESIIMNNRNAHFNYAHVVETEIDRVFEKEKDTIVKAIKFIVDHPEFKYSTENKNLAAWEELENTYRIIRRRWGSSIPNVKYALGAIRYLRLIPEAADHIPPSIVDCFEPGGKKGGWLEPTFAKNEGFISEIKNFQYSVTMTFLEACIPIIEKAMRDKGNLSYFDYQYYLRDMLRNDAEKGGKLIRYISNRHSFFLIDEFQDTNPLQAEIFFYLCSENPQPKWTQCEPRPGSLFIVGDPKQSIYRFCSADVTSYLNVKKLFKDNVLYLTSNFRSTDKVCEYFDRIFPKMLPEDTRDQSKYEKIDKKEEICDELQGIYSYYAYTGTMEKEHPEETDPKQVVSIVKRLVNNENYKIRTNDDKTPRSIEFGDIMVITSSKKKIKPILNYMDEVGIPTRVEGNVPFGENKALIEIYKVYAAIADPGDTISLYGALTGKLIGLSNNEIIEYKQIYDQKYNNDNKRKHRCLSLKTDIEIDEHDGSTYRVVASKINELIRLHRKASKLSPAALFFEILENYRVYERVEAKKLEIVYYTLELIRNGEQNGTIVTLKDGSDYLGELISESSEVERCLSLNDDKNAVHIANLHKVKGLEAPVVILTTATKYEHAPDMRIEHLDDGVEGYIFSISKQKEGKEQQYDTLLSTSDYPDENSREAEALKAENLRLSYVAATRARNVLVIGNGIGGKALTSKWCDISEPETPDIFTATEDGNNVVVKEQIDVAATPLYNDAQKSCVLNGRASEDRSFVVKKPSHQHIGSKIEEEEISVSDISVDTDEGNISETLDLGAHKYPSLLGTTTHKLMEMIVSTSNKVDPKRAIDEIINEYITPALESYETELRKALTEVADRIQNGGYPQNNAVSQDILSTLLNADEVYCEVPFCYSEEGEEGKVVWNGIMDVVYSSQGKWHIVDYKTNSDGNDLDEKYKGQLDAYVRAFKVTTGQDADAMTYHIAI